MRNVAIILVLLSGLFLPSVSNASVENFPGWEYLYSGGQVAVPHQTDDPHQYVMQCVERARQLDPDLAEILRKGKKDSDASYVRAIVEDVCGAEYLHTHHYRRIAPGKYEDAHGRIINIRQDR